MGIYIICVLFATTLFFFFFLGGWAQRTQGPPGGWAQGSQAGAAKCTIESGAQVGYSGNVKRRDAATRVQVQGKGLTLERIKI